MTRPTILFLAIGGTVLAGALPNFSRAAYRCGERPLPQPPATVNIKQFGAVGDGRADDTAAFQKAVAEAGVVFIPTGRYVLTDTVRIGGAL